MVLTGSILLSGASMQASAFTTSLPWGTGASTTTLTCATFSANCGVGTGPIGSGPSVDNYQNEPAFSDVSDARGNATAYSFFSDSNGLAAIHLKGQANGTTGIAEATATGLNSYTYSGSSSTIKTLNIALSGTITDPNNNAFTELTASVYIFDSQFLLPETVFLSGYLGEGLFPSAEAHLSIGGSDPANTSIDIDIDPNETFTIWAILNTNAGPGASVQAMNSLELSFSDNSGLSSAAPVSAVPVPAAAWLFMTAILTVFTAPRRKL